MTTHLNEQEAKEARRMHARGFGTWDIASYLRCSVTAVEWALLGGRL